MTDSQGWSAEGVYLLPQSNAVVIRRPCSHSTDIEQYSIGDDVVDLNVTTVSGADLKTRTRSVIIRGEVIQYDVIEVRQI